MQAGVISVIRFKLPGLGKREASTLDLKFKPWQLSVPLEEAVNGHDVENIGDSPASEDTALCSDRNDRKDELPDSLVHALAANLDDLIFLIVAATLPNECEDTGMPGSG